MLLLSLVSLSLAQLVSGMFIYVPCDHPLTIRLESDPMPQQSTDTTLPIPKFKSFEVLFSYFFLSLIV